MSGFDRPLRWLRNRMAAQCELSAEALAEIETAIKGEAIPVCAASLLIDFRAAIRHRDAADLMRTVVPLMAICTLWMRSHLPSTVKLRPRIVRARDALRDLADSLRAGVSNPTLAQRVEIALRELADEVQP